MSDPANPIANSIAGQEALGNAFFEGNAAKERARLRAEELAAQDVISEATGITDPKLLAELAGLGIRVDTLSALTLLPLIDVAWADGEMDEAERDSVLAGAVSAGIEEDSTSYRLLQIWLEERQAPDITLLWHAFTRALCDQLEPTQIEHLKENILGRARKVASAAGDTRKRTPHISTEEESCLSELAKAFYR